jgi:hypothetical protein
MAEVQTTEQKLLEYRAERYLEMKFTPKESDTLASTRGDDGLHLDYRKVRKALDGGCSHAQAMKIFA